jgi:hypothetical protein
LPEKSGQQIPFITTDSVYTCIHGMGCKFTFKKATINGIKKAKMGMGGRGSGRGWKDNGM